MSVRAHQGEGEKFELRREDGEALRDVREVDSADLVTHEALWGWEEDSSNILRLTASKGGHFLKILCTQKTGVVKEGINVMS